MNIYRQHWGRYLWFFSPSISFREGTRVQGQNKKIIRTAAWRRPPLQRGKSSDNDCHLFFLTSQSTLFLRLKNFSHTLGEERDLQCILYVYVYTQEIAKHDN